MGESIACLCALPPSFLVEIIILTLPDLLSFDCFDIRSFWTAPVDMVLCGLNLSFLSAGISALSHMD